MTKVLRRLSVGSVAFEHVGAGVGKKSYSAADIAAALSYSKLSYLSHELIRCKVLNEGTDKKLVELAALLISPYLVEFSKTRFEQRLLPVFALIALTEFCRVPATYKATVKNRAAFAGCTESYWKKYRLSEWVKKIAADIGTHYLFGLDMIEEQINSLCDPHFKEPLYSAATAKLEYADDYDDMDDEY